MEHVLFKLDKFLPKHRSEDSLQETNISMQILAFNLVHGISEVFHLEILITCFEKV
jgi:hypothetical protein